MQQSITLFITLICFFIYEHLPGGDMKSPYITNVFNEDLSNISNFTDGRKILLGKEVTKPYIAPYFSLVWTSKFDLNVEDVKVTNMVSTCGGVVIAARFVLTAAHCIQGILKRKTPAWLVMGVNDKRDLNFMVKNIDGLLPRADLAHCHPKFNINYGPYEIHDICLMRMDHLLRFGEYINKAALPWQAYDKQIQGKQLIVSGYGHTGIGFSYKLLSTNLRLRTHEECESIFNKDLPFYLREFHRCTGSIEGKKTSTCYGDSGGGLIYQDNITGCPTLIGVVGSGSPYSKCDVSTIFALVSSYQIWIEQIIERFSRDGNIRKYNYPERNFD